MASQESPGEASVFGRIFRSGPAISAVLFISCCIAYIPATKLDFNGLDDYAYVTANKHISAGFTRQGVQWAFTSFDPDNWFPLTRLSYMLDYALFGLDAWWYHLVNILIHGAATIMLFGFLRRATGNRPASFFVAAVFALHPLHVESVAWVAERKDVLCAFFWFASLWVWVACRERPSLAKYIASLALFACGLMSKPMIVTLPLLLPLLEIWPLRQPFSRRKLVRMLPFAALSLTAGILTVLAQSAVGATNAVEGVSAAQRIANALITPFMYIGKTLWPTNLSAEYGWPATTPVWTAVLAGLSIAGISALVLALRRERLYLVTGWFWFLITLLPVIGIVQAGPQSRADRYMYVPMTGLLIIVAWGTDDLVGAFRARRPWLVAAVFGLSSMTCLGLAAVTWGQQHWWESVDTLLRHAIEIDDRNYLAWEYLGTSRDVTVQLRQRIDCYRAAVQLRPDYPDLHASLAGALLQAGHIPDAVGEFQAAVRMSPGNTNDRCLLGAALLRGKRVDEAISQLQIAVRTHPESAMARNNLAVALWNKRETNADPATGESAALRDEARKQLERAAVLRPGYAMIHSNLGVLLLATPNGSEEAAHQFVQALGIDPDDAEAHLGLSKTFTDAVALQAHLEEAHKLAPDEETFRQAATMQYDFGVRK